MWKLMTVVLLTLSVAACKKDGNGWTSPNAITEELKVGFGPEDFVLDDYNGRKRILVSCDDRRTNAEPFGEIVAWNLATNHASILPRLKEPAAMPFFPHGIDMKRVGDELLLYAINHWKGDQNTNAVVVYRVLDDALEFVKEYRHPLMISPNDLCIMPDGGFYFSNDKGPGNLITENLFNKYGGSLIYCSQEGDCSLADERLAFPNGIEYRDGHLYLATTRHKALFRYEVGPDGSLANRMKLSNINGMDNLIWHGNELLVSVHPDEIAFVAHSVNQNAKSPSLVYAIDAKTGQSRLVFKDDGKRISGGSTAMMVGKNLYIAQVFEDFLLKVKMD